VLRVKLLLRESLVLVLLRLTQLFLHRQSWSTTAPAACQHTYVTLAEFLGNISDLPAGVGLGDLRAKAITSTQNRVANGTNTRWRTFERSSWAKRM
jgi:hypothetical protein